MPFYPIGKSLPQRFRLVLASFLQASDLPFSDVLTEAEIAEVFKSEGSEFAREEGDVYTPALTLWAFLFQVLYKGEQQGQRTLSAFASQDLHQEVNAPSGHAAFHDVALLARMLLDQAQCQATQPG